MGSSNSNDQTSINVLLVPFPAQGHINPLLQFGKRLASYGGVRCTLAATRFVVSSTKPTPSSVHVAVFSDGCDERGPDELGGVGAPYFARLESSGSDTLDALLVSESELGRPVHVVVYDAFVPWALGVARRRGAACAAFLTQTCAVDILYAHAWNGKIPPANALRPEDIRGLEGLSCQLEMSDMPTFLTDTSYPPSFLELLVNQFLGLDTADHVLVNSFYDLEPQEADYMASTWRAKMVGPTVPSAFLDNRVPDDMSYGIHLHTPMTAECKAWLDAQQPQSVLYVSFGSMASLGPDQMSEVAEGLYNSGKPFLWVVRATETAKLPEGFAGKAKGRALIVPWCPQLDVLAHPHRLHILVLPYPSQGHINPLFQFAKRLAGHSGVRCTVALTRFVASSARPATGSVHVAVFSDGCDDVGPEGVGGHRRPYFDRLSSAGPESVDWLLRSESELGRPVHVVVYDAFLPWAQGVARRHGAACAAFLTQACAVDVLYTHLQAGRIPHPPVREELPELSGLSSRLELTDLPTFMVDKNRPPGLLELLMNQFAGLDTVDHVLVNSFYDLEQQEADYLASTWGAKTVGPTMPSVYLGNGLLDDDDASSGIHLQTPMTSECKAWLDDHPVLSVVYVSFGSIASLTSEQMAEVAEGLYRSGKPFLWVVRSTETTKLPANFTKKAKGRGLIVPWCPQLEVLAHPSVGCFVTHCGWNSTLEAISSGVPIVAMPHWSDQPTNAKYAQDVWRVGVRARPDSEGVMRREEIERCVRHVMEGKMCKEFKARALEWSKKAKKAMSKGGSSDVNMLDFLSKFGHHK
nr:unnamed protein product [Digitaria exilis]